MDVATSDVLVNVESVEMTSVLEDGGEESVVPSLKKPRFDEGVNKMAEIVLVLSALQRIRGGKTPTELELELMVEARSKLAEMCQEFTPKDIIGRDAVGAVIEDLGLNGKVKDQRLGFRAPKLTISEKLSLGKRKMEELKKQPIVSTSSTAPGHSTSANNVSMAHHWPNSEMKASTISVNAAGTHFVRDASGITQSRMERPQFNTGTSQGPVPAGNYFGSATTWSAQPHSSSSTISFGNASDSKVHVQNSSRVTDPSFRPFMSQSPQGTFQGIKGVNHGQTSSPIGNNHHAEIAKLIHKVLQPRAKQNLLWNPPSREYMSKPMKCQMCQGTINEVETLLICDACEKGYHLKCLQGNNMKGVPKSEWHCSSCVQVYNGKSFPPKYGRVMRSATTAKMSSSSAEVQEKKVGNINQEAVSHSETAKATEDEVAMSQTVEAEDVAQAQAVDASYESEGPIGNDAKCDNPSEPDKREDPSKDVTMSQTVEAEDAAQTQVVDANYESEGPIGNHVKCDNPLESLNPPELEKREDPSKDVTERSVSANSQDIISESSLQEENSQFQPPAESNTDHTQQQNITPNVEEAIAKNVTENPQEDQSC